VKFEVAALKENIEGLIADLVKAKPSAAKGVYLKKIAVSSTMGPGIAIDQTCPGTKNKNAIFIFLHFQSLLRLKMAAHPCVARKP
jgi:hypothetical protein